MIASNNVARKDVADNVFMAVDDHKLCTIDARQQNRVCDREPFFETERQMWM